jgi:RNA polymerase sigma factor (sigma-70 family)
MTMIDESQSDPALLRAFAQDRSPQAFAALVERHAGWVYAAAYRQLRDHHLAEDAAQAVFVLLSQRIYRMKPDQKLSGWLFLALGYIVKTMQRSQRRRRGHERLAAMQHPEVVEDRPALAGELDAAVARLPREYRTAVLLRFYQGLEIAAIANQLGITEAAARKRLERAIEHLRRRLGPAASVEALASAALFGAPKNLASLCANLTHTALSGGTSVSTSLAAKGAASLMAAAKLKITLAALFLLFLAGTAATLSLWYITTSPPPPSTPAIVPLAEPVPPAVLTPDQQALELAYGLRPGEIIRWIKPPFIKQRPMLYVPNGFTPANGWNQVPGSLGLWYEGPAKFGLFSIGFPSVGRWTTASLASTLVRNRDYYFSDYEIEGDKQLLNTPFIGDFVFALGRSSQQFQDALRQLFSQTIGSPITLTIRSVDRPVIVFRGDWKPGAGRSRDKKIEIYGLTLGADPKLGEGDRQPSRAAFADGLGEWVNEEVVFEAHHVPSAIYVCINGGDGTPAAKAHAHDLKLVCDHIAGQTGLTWTQETRNVPRLFIERAK